MVLHHVGLDGTTIWTGLHVVLSAETRMEGRVCLQYAVHGIELLKQVVLGLDAKEKELQAAGTG